MRNRNSWDRQPKNNPGHPKLLSNKLWFRQIGNQIKQKLSKNELTIKPKGQPFK